MAQAGAPWRHAEPAADRARDALIEKPSRDGLRAFRIRTAEPEARGRDDAHHAGDVAAARAGNACRRAIGRGARLSGMYFLEDIRIGERHEIGRHTFTAEEI